MDKHDLAHMWALDEKTGTKAQEKYDSFLAGWAACETGMNPARRPYDLKRKCRHFWSREDICETCGIHLAEATR